MAIHSPTDHHRKTAVAHQVAATLSRPAVTTQATAAPKRVEKRTLMGKIALIERVAQRSGKSVKETSAVVNATLETIREALTRGDAVQLTGFGSFGVRTRAAHTGVNPQTRAKMRVPSKRTYASPPAKTSATRWPGNRRCALQPGNRVLPEGGSPGSVPGSASREGVEQALPHRGALCDPTRQCTK